LLDHWISEFWRLGALLAVGLIIGALTGHYALGFLVVLVPYLVRHLYNLYRLDEWLRLRRVSELPDIGGIYEELFHNIYQLQRRSRIQKRRLTDLLSRFREGTAAMPDATVVLKKSNEIEWYNSAASRYLNLHTHDVGQRIDNLFRHPNFVTYLARGDYAQPLLIQSPTDPALSLQIHVVPYGDSQRLLIARDVSRMQRLEQMRRDFVANVSHELRTPLTVLTGFLETMSDARDDTMGQWSRQLELMRAQASRMQLIVQQLLLLSRLETDAAPPRREPVNVPHMLHSICDEARVLSGEKAHDITLDCDEALWLQGNQEELRSAFSNLAFNAVQYTPPKGKIHISWAERDGVARFAVRDSGIGIPEHHIPRLTERFYRVDVGRSREAGGTGLGLAIVKHVMQRHEAVLKIDSIVDQGSEFICTFPAALMLRRFGAQ
jgi:two-component system phosphate regulon sensor histidine kinase PhoR